MSAVFGGHRPPLQPPYSTENLKLKTPSHCTFKTKKRLGSAAENGAVMTAPPLASKELVASEDQFVRATETFVAE